MIPATHQGPGIRRANAVVNADVIISRLTGQCPGSRARRTSSVNNAALGSRDDGFLRRSNCCGRCVCVLVAGTDYPDGAHEQKEYGGNRNEFFHENVC